MPNTLHNRGIISTVIRSWHEPVRKNKIEKLFAEIVLFIFSFIVLCTVNNKENYPTIRLVTQSATFTRPNSLKQQSDGFQRIINFQTFLTCFVWNVDGNFMFCMGQLFIYLFFKLFLPIVCRFNIVHDTNLITILLSNLQDWY